MELTLFSIALLLDFLGARWVELIKLFWEWSWLIPLDFKPTCSPIYLQKVIGIKSTFADIMLFKGLVGCPAHVFLGIFLFCFLAHFVCKSIFPGTCYPSFRHCFTSPMNIVLSNNCPVSVQVFHVWKHWSTFFNKCIHSVLFHLLKFPNAFSLCDHIVCCYFIQGLPNTKIKHFLFFYHIKWSVT